MICECCGTSYDQIFQSGKCGCANCYKVFSAQMLPFIFRVQNSKAHIGKIPSATLNVNQSTVINLREKLKTLVLQERYEEAAIVRDKIKELEANCV